MYLESLTQNGTEYPMMDTTEERRLQAEEMIPIHTRLKALKPIGLFWTTEPEGSIL